MEFTAYSKIVPVNNLRLESKYDDLVPDTLRYNRSSYTLLATDALTPEAILVLLQLHPIITVQKKNYLMVVAGKRIFEAAAFILPPTEEIPVRVLNKNVSEGQLLLLRYMDITVSSLLFRTEVTAVDIYQGIDMVELRQKIWQPPLDKGKRAFAAAIRVKPAALSTVTVRTAVEGTIDQKAEAPGGNEDLDG